MGWQPPHPDYHPRNAMGEHNPDTWDPEPDPHHYDSGMVNIWDPVEHQGFDEPGHWADRDPDMDHDHARRLALRGEFDDLTEHQPLPLLSSRMRGVPTEGVQGSYAHVIRLDEPCPGCSQHWGVHHCHSTMGEIESEHCLLCGYELRGP